MNIPSEDLKWIEEARSQTFEDGGFYYKRYSSNLNVHFLFYNLIYYSGIEFACCLHGPSKLLRYPSTFIPDSNNTIYLVMGPNSVPRLFWATILHEIGHHVIGHVSPCRNFGDVFSQELEAWRFSESHWDQAPLDQPFPTYLKKSCLKSYHRDLKNLGTKKQKISWVQKIKDFFHL